MGSYRSFTSNARSSKKNPFAPEREKENPLSAESVCQNERCQQPGFAVDRAHLRQPRVRGRHSSQPRIGRLRSPPVPLLGGSIFHPKSPRLRDQSNGRYRLRQKQIDTVVRSSTSIREHFQSLDPLRQVQRRSGIRDPRNSEWKNRPRTQSPGMAGSNTSTFAADDPQASVILEIEFLVAGASNSRDQNRKSKKMLRTTRSVFRSQNQKAEHGHEGRCFNSMCKRPGRASELTTSYRVVRRRAIVLPLLLPPPFLLPTETLQISKSGENGAQLPLAASLAHPISETQDEIIASLTAASFANASEVHGHGHGSLFVPPSLSSPSSALSLRAAAAAAAAAALTTLPPLQIPSSRDAKELSEMPGRLQPTTDVEESGNKRVWVPEKRRQPVRESGARLESRDVIFNEQAKGGWVQDYAGEIPTRAREKDLIYPNPTPFPQPSPKNAAALIHTALTHLLQDKTKQYQLFSTYNHLLVKPAKHREDKCMSLKTRAKGCMRERERAAVANSFSCRHFVSTFKIIVEEEEEGREEEEEEKEKK
ncbi:hypothetical protein MBM_09335 [Drepanopeziza brunnea f. sp. 'multigermtubi' MB_m1]|uniref:Uncharacterized protein n=1 Tax=Marssonina brunnea f. sp. multigermtubi (strain MB_m1) TaxID=1072389 RepID=K1XIZ4_MARBU|nr:uncharacterized protein MBM_09335 [Drepanopeziza brunnea f. sp. 'multigermtubi' MB_m1]EKD12469.1 hypothetical protein MBM_09335 [Drepanopeziza brunnea f. sp. 'multigermtubi' MB_m1]